MVTLLGFFFIVSNVICLEIFMPDLVGPVGLHLSYIFSVCTVLFCLGLLNQSPRVRHGCTIALLLACGCELRLLLLLLLWEARTRGTRADSILWVRYSTMDNIDGKQARRTGQSSGLGELFEYDTSFSNSLRRPEYANLRIAMVLTRWTVLWQAYARLLPLD